MNILNKEIFFKNDIVDLSFICQNNKGLDDLISQIEKVAVENLFLQLGEINQDNLPFLQDVLKYYVFNILLRQIINNFNGVNFDSFFWKVKINMGNDVSLAMLHDRIILSEKFLLSKCKKFKVDGFEIKNSFKNVNYYY